MADLATAYLKLVPSLRGSEAAISREIDGIDTTASGRKMGASLGDGMKTGLGGIALGNFLGGMATQAATMAASAIGDVVANAFGNVKEYEQLVGGVDKLFGEASAAVQQHAQEAYRSTGQSANEYMRQVTSFSASLINSLGGDTAKAAEQADVAMRAISDNVNVFGSDIDSVTNAFQGFAKQNYTMLDNLKLGYGGTKTEMERLIADANEYAAANGQAANLTIDSFSDIVTAIELIQQKQGIAGTTAREAATTIEGSMNSAAAAWQNLLTAIGTGEDIGARMDELFTSIVGDGGENPGLLGNIAPALEQIMASLGPAIGELASRAGAYLQEHSQEMMDAAGQFFYMILTAIAQNAPGIIAGLLGLVMDLVGYVVTHIPDMALAGLHLLEALINAIADAVGPAMEKAGEVVTGILDEIAGFVGDLFDAGANLIQGLIDGIGSAIGGVADAITTGLGDAVGGVLDFLGIASPSKLFMGIGENTMAGMAVGIESMAGSTARTMQSAVDSVYSAALNGGPTGSYAGAAPQNGGISGAIKDELSGMGVYLDGNRLVGGITTRMDKALGAFV